MFKEISKDPARLGRFAKAMSIQKNPAAIAALVGAYPWAEIETGESRNQETTLVDVGGSYGTASIALANQFKNLVCNVQDLPGVVAKAPSLHSNMKDRISFMAHDFFTEQPVVADIYFFRHIFHDWPEKYCIDILKCLMPALRPRARILVNEFCLSEPGTIAKVTEQSIR